MRDQTDDMLDDLLETLVDTREQYGFSRGMMAEALGVTPLWLARFEAGLVPIRLNTLTHYGFRLGLTLKIQLTPQVPPITWERSAVTVSWSGAGGRGGRIRAPG